MNSANRKLHGSAWLAGITAMVAFAGSSIATTINLPQVPLYLPDAVPPLNMLVMGRDHKLYYEAYNDASDLDDDNVLDTGYRGYVLKTDPPGGTESPFKIDYYGYFDSFKCYTHDGARFNPAHTTATKKCGGGGEWSGDYLNYVTTSRIDALRKVLYGGQRLIDDDGLTVLSRSHIPMDAHSWGKEYSTNSDGPNYNIRDYTPYDKPPAGQYHLFANTTPNPAAASWTDDNGAPLMRVSLNQTRRIWEWVSKESPVAGTDVVTINSDIPVRVAVCVAGLKEPNCQTYPNGKMKPIGLLQEFGQDDSMYFGLLSGSYTANKSGGVLRRPVGSIRDEIDASTGKFNTAYQGIIHTIDHLRAAAYTRYTNGGGTNADCNLGNAKLGEQPMLDGECRMWGNPVGEMMYETMRYFAGKKASTKAFSDVLGPDNRDIETRLSLPRPSWDDPYASRPFCSKPFETVISDVNVSYDSDQLPGSMFTREPDSEAIDDVLDGLDVGAIAKVISNGEPDITGQRFIGESLSNPPPAAKYDGTPSVKYVGGLSDIRGLAPEEPTKQGSYYSASVANFGATHDINPNVKDKQNVKTFVVALSSPLPRIEIKVGDKTMTLVPFGKSVGGCCGINGAEGRFQPTNQIVDFYVEKLTNTSGVFQVSFEDVESGNDHDMDAIVRYEYNVVGNQVTVTASSDYAAGGIIQHMGYVVSGAAPGQNGVYLEVRDRDTNAGDDIDYFLDTPLPTGVPDGCRGQACARPGDGAGLPLSNTRVFTVGDAGAAGILKDPLWYAAKWGGFDERVTPADNRDDTPNVKGGALTDTKEWDGDGDGTPDNYFLVTNALKLADQLRSAFKSILNETTSSSSASVNSGSISGDTRVYQAVFKTDEWTGNLLAYKLDPKNGAIAGSDWNAAGAMPGPGARKIFTLNSDGKPVAFQWDSLDNTRKSQLTAGTDGLDLVSYLRGDDTNEVKAGKGKYRKRATKLGDIVSSSPLYVGKPPFRYRESLQSPPYSGFASANATRKGMVYAGANDGMLHGFDAENGSEVFAFIPSAVFPRLKLLADPNYSHQFYVDGAPSMGDVFYSGDWHTVLAAGLNRGGQAVYALDITKPTTLANAEGSPGNVFLWEFTDTNTSGTPANGDEDLGFTYSQPSIVRTHSTAHPWVAVFGNGYNNSASDTSVSPKGEAALYIVDIKTGLLVKKFNTHAGSANDPLKDPVTGLSLKRDNGLATPSLVDINSDRIVEYAYAGDLFGNMWKFDLTSSDDSQWKFAFGDDTTPQPLYQVKDKDGNAQPITVRPEVARGPGGKGTIVLFGTGKYLSADDKLSTPERVQSFYGIVDLNTGKPADRPTNRSSLQQQTILRETVFDRDPDKSDSVHDYVNVRITSSNAVGTKLGWYIDFLKPPSSKYEGERQVTNPIVRNGKVVFTTLIPKADPCDFGGSSWVMELDMLEGAALKVSPVDLNNDGEFTTADQVDDTDDGKDNGEVVSGVGSTEGILQSPGVIQGTYSTDDTPENAPGKPVQYLYMPGSSGNMQRLTVNPGAAAVGRQSWRQVR